MTFYDRPIITCTRCGKEVADTITAITATRDQFSRNNQYCSGHEDKKPVNRKQRRKS